MSVNRRNSRHNNRRVLFISLSSLIALCFLAYNYFYTGLRSGRGPMTPVSQYKPGLAKRRGVVAPESNKVFLLLKTGADIAQKRIPIQVETTLKRFPNHRLYSDGYARIGNTVIHNIFENLPPEALQLSDLVEYNIRQKAERSHYNWDPADVKVGNGYGWQSDRYKNIPMLLDAYQHAPKSTEWFLMIDDDTYILSHSLARLTRQLDPDGEYFIGSWARIYDTLSNSGSVARRLKAEAGDPNFNVMGPFPHGGSGVLLSRGLVRRIIRALNQKPELIDEFYMCPQKTCCGDMALSHMVRELFDDEIQVNNIPSEMISPDPFLGNSIYDTYVSVEDPCVPVISFHHLSPEVIQTLYEWESSMVDRKTDLSYGITYNDFYHDHILPFILEKRIHWDNLAGSAVFKNEEVANIRGKDFIPSANSDQCRLACNADEECYQWKYVHSKKECWFERDKIMIGFSTNSKSNSEPVKIESGWAIDRIRALRASISCDPLMKTDEGYNDDPFTSEGWFFSKHRG